MSGEKVEAPWRTLVLVCSKCRGARKGPDAAHVRRGLKKALGKPTSLRVMEVDCLKVCPEEAVTVCMVDTAPHRIELRLIESTEDIEALAKDLARVHDRAPALREP